MCVCVCVFSYLSIYLSGGNKRTSVDHPNYNIIEINQNTEKSPGDMTKLAVPQTPVRNNRLTPV